MPNDLVELARICATHSRSSPDLDVAAQLMRMALEYQCRAVEPLSPDPRPAGDFIESVPIAAHVAE